VAGEDELVDPEHAVVGEALGHLVMTADQRRARATADQADPGPIPTGILR